MNTAIVVWVLMSHTYSAYWVPTLEFSTQAKCEADAAAIREQTGAHSSWISSARKGWCAKIEK